MLQVFELITFSLFISFTSTAQVTIQNIGFETGTFNGWEGQTGNCCPVYTTYSGIIPGQHTITSGTGTDPITNGLIQVTAPGSVHSVKLGNDNISAEAERLSAAFVVPADSLILLIHYATVIENGSHPDYKQSRFSYSVSSSGNTPEGCTNVEILAGDTSGAIISVGDIEIHPWKSNAINLFGLTGDTIFIQFTTADCAQGGHFGYAYVDCEVVSADLISDGCDINGNIQASINPVLDIRWHDGSINNNISINQPVSGGNYYAEFNYSSDCNFYIPVPVESIITTPTFSYNEFCQNQIEFINTSIAPAGTYFTWDFGDGTGSVLSNPLHQYTAANQFQVFLNAHLPNNCTGFSFANITTKEELIQTINFSDSCVNELIIFDGSSSNPSLQPSSYHWYINENFSANGPVFQHVFNQTGNYLISLIYKDQFGCYDTIYRSIEIIENPDCISPEFTFYLPNAFSPNADGVNDTFKAQLSSYSDKPEILIFNRYGELIFSGTEWDGKHKGIECMEGIYFYKCFVLIEHEYYSRYGSITLIK